MKWEIGALKILARNPTVPGIALRDAIEEIETLQDRLKRTEDNVSALKGELKNVKKMWKDDLDELRSLRGGG
jgi:hypothetical protein